MLRTHVRLEKANVAYGNGPVGLGLASGLGQLVYDEFDN